MNANVANGNQRGIFTTEARRTARIAIIAGIAKIENQNTNCALEL